MTAAARAEMPKLFLVWAPTYTHRSSGGRALYRLCHHLNLMGYPSAMLAHEGNPLPDWNCPLHVGEVGDSIVVYPEVVSGNPNAAARVVRWVLNTPGLLGGDTVYAANEMVFVYDPQRLGEASIAAGTALTQERVLWTGLVDPAHIYPDPRVPKTLDCSFTYKGAALARRFPLPGGLVLPRLEDMTGDMAALGDLLRRTRTLYSYDHYSNVLREAAISGCDVRVVDEHGHWHDPRTCRCARNIVWQEDLVGTYAERFTSSAFVTGFIRTLRERWSLPDANPWWRAIQPFR